MNHFARFASLLVALLFSLGAVADPIPAQDPLFNFTFSIGPNTGFGSLNTVDNGGGSFHAIGGSLTVTGGLDIGTYSLGAGGPAFTISPTGAFGFDNLLFPGQTPALSTGGLFFTGNGLEINIGGLDFANGYFFASCFVATGCISHPHVYNVLDLDENGLFSISVPEPATLALLGIGLAGIGFSRRRKT